MSETPDFAKIARLLRSAAVMATHAPDVAVGAIEGELVKVWNARGAADRMQIEHDLSSQMGATAAGPYVKNLERALRTLDR